MTSGNIHCQIGHDPDEGGLNSRQIFILSWVFRSGKLFIAWRWIFGPHGILSFEEEVVFHPPVAGRVVETEKFCRSTFSGELAGLRRGEVTEVGRTIDFTIREVVFTEEEIRLMGQGSDFLDVLRSPAAISDVDQGAARRDLYKLIAEFSERVLFLTVMDRVGWAMAVADGLNDLFEPGACPESVGLESVRIDIDEGSFIDPIGHRGESGVVEGGPLDLIGERGIQRKGAGIG